jgi:crotonobetainyl-CoA:carnitine CoA-transferase CaiB-like acyl-CoA transferase
MSTQPLPLDGITVVAVEQAVAAPFATRQLADLGARVIKVERAGRRCRFWSSRSWPTIRASPRTPHGPRTGSSPTRWWGQVLARLTGEDAVAGLDAAGIACARLNSVADVVAHPQPAARDRWREVESPAGPLRALLPPITLPGGVEARMGAVPALGNTPTQLCGPWG